MGDQSLGLALVKSFIGLHGGTVKRLDKEGPISIECILPRNTEAPTTDTNEDRAGPDSA